MCPEVVPETSITFNQITWLRAQEDFIILSICLSLCLSMALQPSVVPWPLIQFLDIYTFCRTPWTGDQPVARPLSTHRTAQIQNKCTQTTMPQVGFEPTIPVSEQAETVHVLDRTATVTGSLILVAVKS
jgi:hypothetical protein